MGDFGVARQFPGLPSADAEGAGARGAQSMPSAAKSNPSSYSTAPTCRQSPPIPLTQAGNQERRLHPVLTPQEPVTPPTTMASESTSGTTPGLATDAVLVKSEEIPEGTPEVHGCGAWRVPFTRG